MISGAPGRQRRLTNLRRPPASAPALGTAAERRRLVYCLFGALVLHASATLWRQGESKAEVAHLATPHSVIPVSFEETPPATMPKPDSEPPVQRPPEPPPRPERNVAAPAPAKPAKTRLAQRSARQPPDPPAPADSTDPADDDAAAFGGSTGAFQADVCFVRRGIESALVLEGCDPVASFFTNEINVAPRRFRRGFPGVEKRIEWFGIAYRGRFTVRESGYFTFRLVSDDGALLFVDEALVLDNDGLHSPRSVKMAMPLSAGEHRFRLLYYQGPGDRLALQLFVKTYKTPERLFGPEL